MLAVLDIVGLVARKGPLTMDELEEARLADIGGLWVVLDLCVEHGILDCETDEDGTPPGTYCLTPRGRQLLDLAAAGVAAA